jgi:hypothetical protein
MNHKVPTIAPISRQLAVDGLRGLLLIIIAINHLEGEFFTRWTREPFGFVSAAEAFIFLSGWVAARVYGRYTHDFHQLRTRIWRRVFTLYVYTMGGVLLITAALHFDLLPTVVVAPDNHYFALNNYREYPFTALILSLAQLQQMSFFDILILYMLPMIFLPWALMALARKQMWKVLGASGLLWLAAPVVQDQWLATALYNLIPHWRVEAGYMDIFGWQLLFYLGVCCSYQQYFNDQDWGLNRLWVTATVFFIAILFAGLHKHWWTLTLPDALNHWLFSWQDMGLIRIGNTLTLAYCVAWLISRCPSPWQMPWLVLLGQHSLQVFVYHCVAIYGFWAWMYAIKQDYSVSGDILVTAIFILSLWLPALLHQYWQTAATGKATLNE